MNGKCPKDSALIALFMNEASARDTERLLRHLARCARCALRFNVLRQVKRDLQPHLDAFAKTCGPDEGVSLLRNAARQKARALDPDLPAAASRAHDLRVRPWGPIQGFRSAVAGVILFAAAAGGAYLALHRPPRAAELRSAYPKLALLAPLGALRSAPGLFRWTPVLHAEDYSLEILDDSLDQIYIGGTFLVTEALLPASARSRLVRGRSYVWSITAEDGDGNILATETGSFTIE